MGKEVIQYIETSYDTVFYLIRDQVANPTHTVARVKRGLGRRRCHRCHGATHVPMLRLDEGGTWEGHKAANGE